MRLPKFRIEVQQASSRRDLVISPLSGALVRRFDVQPSDFSSTWNLIRVHFVDSVAAGSVVNINIVYHGTPTMPDDGINRITPEWVELSLESRGFASSPRLLQTWWETFA